LRYSEKKEFLAMFKNYVLLGGLLPILAFVVVEQIYGVKGGVIAGLVFCAGEIAWELRKTGKVQGFTILSCALIVILGALSLWEEDGVFFKLQPAIFLAVFAAVFFISSILGRPFLLELSRKQNPNLPPALADRMKGMNIRVALLFVALAGLSAYAAFYWSTAAWATLKAAGLPVLMLFYVILELVWIRASGRDRSGSR